MRFKDCCHSWEGHPHVDGCAVAVAERMGIVVGTVAVRIRPELHRAVEAEMSKAVAKHGGMQTPAGGALSDGECLVILVEEIGEVARAMTYDEGDPDNLDKEIIQVATMALAWLEGRILKREAAFRDERYEVRHDGGDHPIRVMNGLGETVHGNGYATAEAPDVPLKVYDKLKQDTGELPVIRPVVNAGPLNGPGPLRYPGSDY